VKTIYAAELAQIDHKANTELSDFNYLIRTFSELVEKNIQCEKYIFIHCCPLY